MQTPQSDEDPAFSEALHELGAVEASTRVEHEFGARVKEARQLLGMTQRQLADAVGLDASAISRLEQGSRAIRLGEAALIADAVKTDVRELLYGDLSDDPRLPLHSASDELEKATAQLRDANIAAELGLDGLRTVLDRADVREYLAISPVDVDNTIGMCSHAIELLSEHDHPRLLRLISAELVDMDQPNLIIRDTDGPET